MLYHLLYELLGNLPLLGVFKYQTFRAMIAFLFAFTLVLVFQPRVIRYLKKLGGQPIRTEGPKSHFSKEGTPTMGGIAIVGAVLLSALLFCDLTVWLVWVAMFGLASFAFIGFIDDWLKVAKKNNAGLTERAKITLQIIAAFLISITLYLNGFSTELSIPFFKNFTPDLGLLFIPFSMLVIVATSNAVNLTDGLDGLAIGPVMTVAATYSIFAYLSGHSFLAKYLGIMHVAGAGEVAVILSAVVASGLGFLWYNTFPAQIFMGDIGALALGGLLGTIAVLVKHELVLIITGGVFVLETVSVIIQRYFYKMTKKRVFKMAPIHHHFELLGIPEPKVIVRFWIVSIVLALISLTTLKLR